MESYIWKINKAKLKETNLAKYSDFIKANYKINSNNDFNKIWKWSIENPPIFWKSIWEFTKVTGGYYINTKKENAEAIGNESFVRDITLYKMDKSLTSERIFPDRENYPWNTDYYGPLLVLYEGLEIDINRETISKFGSTILNYENIENVKLEGQNLLIENEIVSKYIFKQDYYFMMGDNRHNSEDSRFWGFVPYDHILGEASFIWFSYNYQEDNLFKAIRWDRFLNVIK